jgi:hypothetical protein
LADDKSGLELLPKGVGLLGAMDDAGDDETGLKFGFGLLKRPLDEGDCVEIGLEGAIDELNRLLAPNLFLLPSNFKAGVAVIVGVKSDRVTTVAELGVCAFFVGLNVGRLVMAKGLIIGVNDFLAEP